MVALTVVSVAIMLLIIVYTQISIEKKHAYEMSMKTFSQMEQVLEENHRELAEIQKQYRQQCLNNAETIARIIEGEPELIYNVAALKELAEIIEVDEIHIFDSTGRIFAGTHPEYYNYTFDSGEQMRFFKPMLQDKSLQLVQDITPNTAEGKLMQYSAIWNRKGDLIVQVGMEPVSVMQETEKNELSYIFSLFSVTPDASFYAMDVESGAIIGATVAENVGKMPQEIGLDFAAIKTNQEGFFATVNGQRSYCVFQKVDDAYLGRIVSEQELFQRIPTTIFQLAVCLTAIVLILALASTIFMNKFVVRKIQAINETLNDIAKGNLNERVHIRSSLEFSELSDYLNSMIKALLDNNKKMSYVLRKTNLYIGVYEYNSQIKKVQYTEYLPKLLGVEESQMANYSQFRACLDKIRENPVLDVPGTFQLMKGTEQYIKLEEFSEQNRVFGVVIDVTESVLRRRKIEFERDMDSLTGLYNRRGLDIQLEALFKEREKLGHSAFIMVDADGLKEVNDTYGHQKGDLYLKKVADVLKNFGSKRSVVARQGGDEFVLFLYQYDDAASLLATLETLTEIQECSSACFDATLCVPIRFSFGYCLTGQSADYHSYIKEADKQMYENKRARKGCCKPLAE